MHYALPVIKETWNDIQSENIERAEGKAVVVTKGTGATSVVYFYYLYIHSIYKYTRVILSL